MNIKVPRPNGFYWVLKGAMKWGEKEWVVAHWGNFIMGTNDYDPDGWTLPNSEEYWNDGDFLEIKKEPIPRPKD
jgi:hypothetical protein